MDTPTSGPPGYPPTGGGPGYPAAPGPPISGPPISGPPISGPPISGGPIAGAGRPPVPATIVGTPMYPPGAVPNGPGAAPPYGPGGTPPYGPAGPTPPGGKVPLADRRWLLPGAIGVLAAGVIAGCVMGALALVPASNGRTASGPNPIAGQPTIPADPAAPPDTPPTPSTPPSQPASQQLPSVGVLRGGDRCLEMDKDDNARKAQMAACSSDDNQRWQFKSVGGDQYQLINAATGKCLDVKGRSKNDGATVQQFACRDQENQKWRLRPIGSDAFALVGVGSDKCADIEKDGDVKQRDCDNGDGQRWQATAA